eukprot:COSAG01_NODE_3179_length_6459_cov_2258.702201_2_plen_373_part_00
MLVVWVWLWLAGTGVAAAAQQPGAVPQFNAQHPDANPGPRSNQALLGKHSSTGQQTLQAGRWRLVRGWPTATPSAISSRSQELYGQVTGVDVDAQGRVWVLHRTPARQWDGAAFDFQNRIRYTRPIVGHTIVRYPSEDATSIDLRAGANMLQMPHMITADAEGNIWVVDCGLHQVLKFGAGGGLVSPLLTLGVANTPGSDDRHFCKPTDVAVRGDGHFYVSDGYCNSRVVHYNPEGRILNQWGSYGSGAGQFRLPHGLAWDAVAGILYVADRENHRVQVFSAAGKFVREYGGIKQGWGAVFGIAVKGGRLHVTTVGPAQLRVIDTVSGASLAVMDTPRGTAQLMPHDVAVTSRGTIFVAESKLNALYKYQLE